MLQPAYLYKDEIYKYKSKIALNERYKYFEWGDYADFNINIEDNQWNKIQLVSVDTNNNLVGYFQASINRSAYHVKSLLIANFSSKPNYTFAKDLQQFFIDLFYKYNFNKIDFIVAIGNPSEKMYDKLVNKYGGKIMGVYKEDVKLWDGKLYDSKSYEIMRSEFLKKYNQTKGENNEKVPQ